MQQNMAEYEQRTADIFKKILEKIAEIENASNQAGLVSSGPAEGDNSIQVGDGAAGEGLEVWEMKEQPLPPKKPPQPHVIPGQLPKPKTRPTYPWRNPPGRETPPAQPGMTFLQALQAGCDLETIKQIGNEEAMAAGRKVFVERSMATQERMAALPLLPVYEPDGVAI
jgi:hypothetical protein